MPRTVGARAWNVADNNVILEAVECALTRLAQDAHKAAELKTLSSRELWEKGLKEALELAKVDEEGREPKDAFAELLELLEIRSVGSVKNRAKKERNAGRLRLRAEQKVLPSSPDAQGFEFGQRAFKAFKADTKEEADALTRDLIVARDALDEGENVCMDEAEFASGAVRGWKSVAHGATLVRLGERLRPISLLSDVEFTPTQATNIVNKLCDAESEPNDGHEAGELLAGLGYLALQGHELDLCFDEYGDTTCRRLVALVCKLFEANKAENIGKVLKGLDAFAKSTPETAAKDAANLINLACRGGLVDHWESENLVQRVKAEPDAMASLLNAAGFLDEDCDISSQLERLGPFIDSRICEGDDGSNFEYWFKDTEGLERMSKLLRRLVLKRDGDTECAFKKEDALKLGRGILDKLTLCSDDDNMDDYNAWKVEDVGVLLRKTLQLDERDDDIAEQLILYAVSSQGPQLVGGLKFVVGGKQARRLRRGLTDTESSDVTAAVRDLLAKQAGPTLRIGSWNVADFTAKSVKDVDRRLKNIAQTITEGRYDVIALQEVQSGPGGTRAVNLLKERLNKQENVWDAKVCKFPASYKETFGFVWRTDELQMTCDPELVSGHGDHCFSTKLINKAAEVGVTLRNPKWTNKMTGSFFSGNRPYKRIPAFAVFKVVWPNIAEDEIKGLVIGNAHFHSDGPLPELSRLRHLLEACVSSDGLLVVCGDFNTDRPRAEDVYREGEIEWNRLFGEPPHPRVWENTVSLEQPTNLWPAVKDGNHYDNIIIPAWVKERKQVSSWVQHWPEAVQNMLHTVMLDWKRQNDRKKTLRGGDDNGAIVNAFKACWSDHRPVGFQIPMKLKVQPSE
ncbi:hypothetical protein RI054_29g119170 [Pseudoscourfieldia marina]